MPVWQEKIPILRPMIKVIFIFVLMLVSMAGMSQTDTVKPNSFSEDAILTNVDSASSYPGGDKAWQLFLVKNMRFPQETIDKVRGRKSRQWDVMIRFVVTKEGKVKDVIAETSLGGGLEEEAIRLIRKSGNWIPAKQNGVPVNSYKRQPVIFRLEIG